jgi:gluconokinase
VHQEDASAIGAAYLGLVSTGLVNTYDELEPSNKASFHPNEKDHKVYQKIFPIYERLYQKLEDEMQLLSEL